MKIGVFLSALLVVAALVGCNRGVNEVLPDGTKLFGKRTLKDGTKKIREIDYPDGGQIWDVTVFHDDTLYYARGQRPNGEKDFNGMNRRDNSGTAEKIEFADGTKMYGVTIYPDGTYSFLRATGPDGKARTVFSNAQDDDQGYSGVKWGTDIANLAPNASGQSQDCFLSGSDDFEQNSAVAAALGVPNRQTATAGIVLSTSLDYSLIPRKCKVTTNGDVKFIFYDDKMAMALSTLDAHNYDEIASELTSKYSEVIEGGTTARWGDGAASDGDSTEVQSRLFKRGNTNTRIYLLKRTNHMGIGMNVSSLYLLYIPNNYYLKIQNEISNMKLGKDRQRAADQERQEQPDFQKIQ